MEWILLLWTSSDIKTLLTERRINPFTLSMRRLLWMLTAFFSELCWGWRKLSPFPLLCSFPLAEIHTIILSTSHMYKILKTAIFHYFPVSITPFGRDALFFSNSISIHSLMVLSTCPIQVLCCPVALIKPIDKALGNHLFEGNRYALIIGWQHG